jgi:hypothetical protein
MQDNVGIAGGCGVSLVAGCGIHAVVRGRGGFGCAFFEHYTLVGCRFTITSNVVGAVVDVLDSETTEYSLRGTEGHVIGVAQIGGFALGLHQ